ncbi:MAG: BMC domain-containing protein [Bacillota bacterium]|nr:BMC domain-containing protein [Bacillota bacterium]MDW7676398.1 BMC domain-containing protein [Bacillota bacterium]
MKSAVGMIEAIGLTAAITALDAACKTADVTLIGFEKVIGAGKAVTVTVHITGEVAAVQAGVDAGVAAALKTGSILAYHVIPRPHEEVQKLIESFQKKKHQKNEVKKRNKTETPKMTGSIDGKPHQ